MLDVAAAGLVALFALMGFLTGLLLQALRLIAAALAMVIALHCTAPAMNAWPDLLATVPSVRQVAFPAGIFCASYLVLSLVASVIASVFHRGAPALSAADRLLGGLVGAVKGVVIAWFAVSVVLAGEQAAGRPVPRLETGSSWAASLVRQCPVGRLGDPGTWGSLLHDTPGGQGGTGH